MDPTKAAPALTPFQVEVQSRFGVLPNFFLSGGAVPGLIEHLWQFARAAYLDNPLPSVFKERLFVYLSQFCRIRYCIIRHVGFLIGLGRPAGDATVSPQSVDDVIALLERPRPDFARFTEAVDRLSHLDAINEMPAPGSTMEADLFDVLTLLFLTPLAVPKASDALHKAVGPANFELLVAFLAFVKTAHYWTETHPDIGCEPDALKMLNNHPALARLLLQQPQSITL